MDIFISILLLFFTLFIVIILTTLAWAGFSAAPWVPVRQKDIKRIFELAQLKPGEQFYDLGCGDGRLIITAYKDFLAKPTGIELSLLQYFFCCFRIRLLGLSNKISLIFGSFYQKDLSPADVIFAFLTPMAMRRLKPKFERELKAGCRVISYAFAVPGWQPQKISKLDKKSISIYLYQR